MNFCPTQGLRTGQRMVGMTTPLSLEGGGAFETRRRRGSGNIAEASVCSWEHDGKTSVKRNVPFLIVLISYLVQTVQGLIFLLFSSFLSCTDYKMLYYFVQLYWKRVKNLLVDLCALIMAVPVNEADTYVFDCAVQLDVTPVGRRDCGWGPTL